MDVINIYMHCMYVIYILDSFYSSLSLISYAQSYVQYHLTPLNTLIGVCFQQM